jgi:hypothetical protein
LLQDIAGKLTDCPGIEPPPLRPDFADGLHPGQTKPGLTTLTRVAMATHALDQPPASVDPAEIQAPSFARAFNITLGDTILQQLYQLYEDMDDDRSGSLEEEDFTARDDPTLLARPPPAPAPRAPFIASSSSPPPPPRSLGCIAAHGSSEGVAVQSHFAAVVDFSLGFLLHRLCGSTCGRWTRMVTASSASTSSSAAWVRGMGPPGAIQPWGRYQSSEVQFTGL